MKGRRQGTGKRTTAQRRTPTETRAEIGDPERKSDRFVPQVRHQGSRLTPAVQLPKRLARSTAHPEASALANVVLCSNHYESDELKEHLRSILITDTPLSFVALVETRPDIGFTLNKAVNHLANDDIFKELKHDIVLALGRATTRMQTADFNIKIANAFLATSESDWRGEVLPGGRGAGPTTNVRDTLRQLLTTDITPVLELLNNGNSAYADRMNELLDADGGNNRRSLAGIVELQPVLSALSVNTGRSL